MTARARDPQGASRPTPGKRGGWNKGQGGGYVDKRGYRWIRRDDGKDVREHRDVMEKSLGRALEPWEIVHHKDGNRLNNALANLEVMTYDAHNIEHKLGVVIKRADERARIHAMHCQQREEIKRLRRLNTRMLEELRRVLDTMPLGSAWARETADRVGALLREIHGEG